MPNAPNVPTTMIANAINITKMIANMINNIIANHFLSHNIDCMYREKERALVQSSAIRFNSFNVSFNATEIATFCAYKTSQPSASLY